MVRINLEEEICGFAVFVPFLENYDHDTLEFFRLSKEQQRLLLNVNKSHMALHALHYPFT